MAGDTAPFEKTTDLHVAVGREQSSIGFPYLDMDAAAEVAHAVYGRSGFGPCDLDELAAEMGQVISGAFRMKTGTARIFGVIDKDGRSSVKLTDLGKQLVNDETARAAKAEAFLRVPLYAAIYDKYKGQRLPPMKALEREMQGLGVSSKQTDKARQALERSARQAGFFDAGDDRLVRPKAELPSASGPAPTESAKQDDGAPRLRFLQHHGSGGGDGPQDPLIVGLVKRLPPAGDDWSSEARATWLRLAISIFDMVYTGGDGTVSVTSGKTTGTNQQ